MPAITPFPVRAQPTMAARINILIVTMWNVTTTSAIHVLSRRPPRLSRVKSTMYAAAIAQTGMLAVISPCRYDAAEAAETTEVA